jgi:Protein of unknown function (DUF2946)
MRRRLEKFLPIVLIAVLVQIIAPIAATWAVTIAAVDPLQAVPICHGAGASIPDQPAPSGESAHDGCCSVCNVAHNGTPLHAPQTVATLFRPATIVVWLEPPSDRLGSRPGSHAQARAPPSFS